MSTEIITQQPRQRQTVLAAMAERYSVEPTKLLDTLRDTVFAKANDSQLVALCIVANEYQLNPFTKQIYAFPDSKSGGIVPVVGVDGWIAILNRHPDYDGAEFEFHDVNGKLESCTCTIYLKSRPHRPVKVTEYLAECTRATDPWRISPRRMLRHKALIQCGRLAFGLAGLHDEDDAEVMMAKPIEAKVVPPPAKPKVALPPAKTEAAEKPEATLPPNHESSPESGAPSASAEAPAGDAPADDAATPAVESGAPAVTGDLAEQRLKLSNLVKASNVTEAQVLTYLATQGFEVETWDKLDTVAIDTLAKNWGTVVAALQAEAESAAESWVPTEIPSDATEIVKFTREHLAKLGLDEAKVLAFLKLKKHTGPKVMNLSEVATGRLQWLLGQLDETSVREGITK